jgi:hypothetical protein
MRGGRKILPQRVERIVGVIPKHLAKRERWQAEGRKINRMGKFLKRGGVEGALCFIRQNHEMAARGGFLCAGRHLGDAGCP